METVYIETTIPSYLASRPSKDSLISTRQKITKEWWDHFRSNFDLYISEVVIDEISSGDVNLAKKRGEILAEIPLLAYEDKVEELAEKYFKALQFPGKAYRDAFHIAFAVYYELDFLLTWNCSHLANAHIRTKLIRYNQNSGLKTPDLCTPEELM